MKKSRLQLQLAENYSCQQEKIELVDYTHHNQPRNQATDMSNLNQKGLECRLIQLKDHDLLQTLVHKKGMRKQHIAVE